MLSEIKERTDPMRMLIIPGVCLGLELDHRHLQMSKERQIRVAGSVVGAHELKRRFEPEGDRDGQEAEPARTGCS